MPASSSAVTNSKHIGDLFEMRFQRAVQERGLYLQQMPERVGFDFLVGDGSLMKPVETKCVAGNKLRLKHFTQIERLTAEEMTEGGIDYTIVFPLYGGFGYTTWAKIREQLFTGGVTLDSPHLPRLF